MERGSARIWAGASGGSPGSLYRAAGLPVGHPEVGCPGYPAHVKAFPDEAHDRTPAEGAARAELEGTTRAREGLSVDEVDHGLAAEAASEHRHDHPPSQYRHGSRGQHRGGAGRTNIPTATRTGPTLSGGRSGRVGRSGYTAVRGWGHAPPTHRRVGVYTSGGRALGVATPRSRGHCWRRRRDARDGGAVHGARAGGSGAVASQASHPQRIASPQMGRLMDMY